MVSTQETAPTQPVILENITVNMINNMFIVSEPKEITEQQQAEQTTRNDLLDFDGLDKDFLEEDLLELDDDNSVEFNALDIDYLGVDLLIDLLDTLDLSVGDNLNEELLDDKQGVTNITGTLNPGFDPVTGYNTIIETTTVWFYRDMNGVISLRLDASGVYQITTQPEGKNSLICVNGCGGSTIFIKQGGG